jgi:hypothetical protein
VPSLRPSLSLLALCHCAPIAPVSAARREVSFETESVTVGE